MPWDQILNLDLSYDTGVFGRARPLVRRTARILQNLHPRLFHSLHIGLEEYLPAPAVDSNDRPNRHHLRHRFTLAIDINGTSLNI